MDLPLDHHLSAEALDQLRDSKVKNLYGNRYRLEVAVAVARAEDPFYLHEIAKATGVEDSPVRSILRDMVDAGLLRPIAGRRGGPQYYERTAPSEYWKAAEAMLAELVAALR
jgi:predicted transcriptional regulator